MKIIIFLTNWAPLAISIGIIILTAIFFIKQKLSKKFLIYCLIFFSAILILKASTQTALTYSLWKSHPFSKYLLPPHQSINYFASYSYFHYFKNLIFTFASSLSIGLLFFCLNKYRKNHLMENKDIWLSILGTSFAGWPGAIIYFFLVLSLMIISHIAIKTINKMRLKKIEPFRLQITPFLIISSLIIIIFNEYLIKITNLSIIK